jgi:hypothetical protein
VNDEQVVYEDGQTNLLLSTQHGNRTAKDDSGLYKPAWQPRSGSITSLGRQCYHTSVTNKPDSLYTGLRHCRLRESSVTLVAFRLAKIASEPACPSGGHERHKFHQSWTLRHATDGLSGVSPISVCPGGTERK